MLLSWVARGTRALGSRVQDLSGPEWRNLCPGGDIAAKLASARMDVGGGARGVHGSMSVWKAEDRKEMLASMPVKDEGTEGEKLMGLDAIRGSGGMFPDEGTPDLLFDGVRFSDLPIIHAKVSKNNTLLVLTDSQGVVKLQRSCGIEGFKNTRKGTNIAAQATAISLATRTLNRGIKNVRVKVKGLGPGRMSAVKGLTMGGLNVVSITDSTPITFNLPQRPRKAKKL